MWYDGDKTLTHGCLYNLVISNRGFGKTYWSKKRAVRNFLKKGKKFIYLRRYDTELELVKDSLFNDIIINNEFPDHTIECKGDCYYIDDKCAGYAMALSKAAYYKSSSYPDVTFIIFDEFLIDTGGTTRYMKNEVNKFLDLYETIDRMRDETIVFMLSNAITFVNPYTIYWNLRLPYNKDIMKIDDLVLLQYVSDTEFIEKKNKTRFGRLVAGSAYGDYAINNKFLRDNNNFVEKKSGSSNYSFTFKYTDQMYGVWVSYSDGKMWVSDNVDPSCKLVYSLTLDDHTPNTLMIKRASKAVFFKYFLDAYKDGNVYFESIKIKNVVYEVIKLYMI